MANKWRHCIKHVFKDDGKLWEVAHVTDVVVNSLIINTAYLSDDASCDTNMEGIELLSCQKLIIYNTLEVIISVSKKNFAFLFCCNF